MTITYPAGIAIDDATKARTEQFFVLAENKNTTDADLTALIRLGICLEARSNDGYTPLMLAAWYNKVESINVLLAAGADIEARGDYGRTPLIIAALHNKTEAIQALLARGANIYAQDKNGNAPVGCRDIRNHEFIPQWQEAYERFCATGRAPQSAAGVYHLLAVTPLSKPLAPVDRLGHLQRIFTHAKWEDKVQVEGIVQQLQADGTIKAEMADALLTAAFPERDISHVARLKPRVEGIVR
jgi:hypothetical protein